MKNKIELKQKTEKTHHTQFKRFPKIEHLLTAVALLVTELFDCLEFEIETKQTVLFAPCLKIYCIYAKCHYSVTAYAVKTYIRILHTYIERKSTFAEFHFEPVKFSAYRL